MRRPLLSLALAVLATAVQAGPAADPLRDLVQQGRRYASELERLEAERTALDREEVTLNTADLALPREVAAMDARVAAFTARDAAQAELIRAHNARCGAGASDAGEFKETRKFKDPKEYEAAKARLAEWQAREAERVAACEAAGTQLDVETRALDAERAALTPARDALQARIDAQNRASDTFSERSMRNAKALSAAEEAAQDWLDRLNALQATPAYAVRAATHKPCAAKREMVVTGADLGVLVGLLSRCVEGR